MQLGNCWIVLNKDGTNVFRRNVTPAEAQLLRNQFEAFCGGNPVTLLEILDGEAGVIVKRDEENPSDLSKAKIRKRSNADEIRRLRGKYTDGIIKALFPGLNPELPATFEEAGFEEGKDWQAVSKGGKNERHLKGPADDSDFAFMAVPEGYDHAKMTKEAS